MSYNPNSNMLPSRLPSLNGQSTLLTPSPSRTLLPPPLGGQSTLLTPSPSRTLLPPLGGQSTLLTPGPYRSTTSVGLPPPLSRPSTNVGLPPPLSRPSTSAGLPPPLSRPTQPLVSATSVATQPLVTPSKTLLPTKPLSPVKSLSPVKTYSTTSVALPPGGKATPTSSKPMSGVGLPLPSRATATVQTSNYPDFSSSQKSTTTQVIHTSNYPDLSGSRKPSTQASTQTSTQGSSSTQSSSFVLPTVSKTQSTMLTQSSATRPTVGPVVSRPTTTALPPIASTPSRPTTTFLPPISPISPISPVSPARYTRPSYSPPQEDVDLAIMNSLANENEPADAVERDMLAAAIAASLEASKQAQIATIEADKIVASPVLSRKSTIMEQDRAYEESLRIDQAKAVAAKAAADAAHKSAEAINASIDALKTLQAAEEMKVAALSLPELRHSIQNAAQVDLITLGFRFPNGSKTTHVFHKLEPLSSLIQTVRFDTKYLGELKFVIPPNKEITCDQSTSLMNCDIQNRDLVMVIFG